MGLEEDSQNPWGRSVILGSEMEPTFGDSLGRNHLVRVDWICHLLILLETVLKQSQEDEPQNSRFKEDL